MKKYNQHCFDEGYYEKFERGGFKGYTWEKIEKEVKMKLNWIDKHYKNKDVKSILFVGCAKGFEVREARERGYNAYGIEPSEYALEHADKSIRKYLEQGDIRDLRTYASNSVDLVCAFDVIHIVDIKSRYNAYNELNRVAGRGIVLRTRVLSAHHSLPAMDYTLDGDITYRETMQSLISKVEQYNKFKIFHAKIDQRCVMWCAFGLEEYFPTTLKDAVNRGIKDETQ